MSLIFSGFWLCCPGSWLLTTVKTTRLSSPKGRGIQKESNSWKQEWKFKSENRKKKNRLKFLPIYVPAIMITMRTIITHRFHPSLQPWRHVPKQQFPIIWILWGYDFFKRLALSKLLYNWKKSFVTQRFHDFLQ